MIQRIIHESQLFAEKIEQFHVRSQTSAGYYAGTFLKASYWGKPKTTERNEKPQIFQGLNIRTWKCKQLQKRPIFSNIIGKGRYLENILLLYLDLCKEIPIYIQIKGFKFKT